MDDFTDQHNESLDNSVNLQAPSQPTPPAHNVRDPVTVESLRLSIAKQASRKTSTMKNLITLLITLLIFFSVGLFDASPAGFSVVIMVVLVHELGHYIGMRIFGYNDVKMFFIPFLGAAVSGKSVHPSGAKKALVSLMGPVPGILIGIACGFAFFATGSEILYLFASTLLFINGFNLLPFYPLDGGRFFEFVLFSRNPTIEIVFKVLTSLLLLATAFLFKAIFLGLFTFFILASLTQTHMSSRIAQEIRRSATEDLDPDITTIPDHHLQAITRKLNDKLKTSDPGLYARYAETIWEKACNNPPSAAAAFFLIVLYIIALSVALSAPFLLETGKVYALSESEIVERVDENGVTRFMEIQKYKGTITHDVYLDEEGYYDGPSHSWYVFGEQKRTDGHWKNGYLHGEVTYWDPDGQLSHVEVYEMGEPIKYLSAVDGSLIEIPEVDWPFNFKNGAPAQPQISEAFQKRK